MAKTIQTQNAFFPLATRVSILVDTALRTIGKLAEERARAQRAAILADLPRQRLAELRALYTQEATPARSDQPSGSAGFRDHRSANDQLRSLT